MSGFFKYRNRLDLSEWIIHFVHKRTGTETLDELSEIASLEGYEMESRYPDYFDQDGKACHILDDNVENEMPLDSHASALDVLMKILHDGYIHTGWSYRNNLATVYGPVSAACFTEMPLYALIDYAKAREEISDYVGEYGIAFKRNELFAAGARPVIYGLTEEPQEKEYNDDDVFQGRILLNGLKLSEQYRYVRTNLSVKPGEKSIDWMMEREWRWALPYNRIHVPGLPFYLSNEYGNFFTEVFVIVSKDSEVKIISDYIVSLYNAKSTNFGIEYDLNKIASTKIISIESLERVESNRNVKIDNLPISQIRLPDRITVEDQQIVRTKEILGEAQMRADSAIQEYLKSNENFDTNKGAWGFVDVVTDEYTVYTQALIDLDIAKTYSDGIYYLGQISSCKSDNIELLLIGARAASDFLSNSFRQSFSVRFRYD